LLGLGDVVGVGIEVGVFSEDAVGFAERGGGAFERREQIVGRLLALAVGFAQAIKLADQRVIGHINTL
jgi:hypothetical protein